ncbi:protein adenylyltransferase SelO, mitochondrial-like isoform X2 [Babylonia areolata]|uniref:protein adenylyltransferase SelO, mitochondrial-like isoform X1 n=1 Tax=Babylonia areolata TaxID=304850 RepID=UPI003FD630CD
MFKRFSSLVSCGEFNGSTPRRNTVQRRSSSVTGRAVVWRGVAKLSRQIRGMATLETLNFDNKALRDLPVDPNPDNRQRQVPGACFSKVRPTPVKNPQLVACSLPALTLLDLPLAQAERADFAHYFSGNKLLPGSQPAAHCYCGHQFGSFAGQLGDGATMYLGEVVNKAGERWEIQFKGAGLTPYSRQADGRKVLRSTIREFLCSEAIHHLGIPTTRAGSCVTSDSTVTRDIFYNGNPTEERCSIVLRIAQSFLRFGSFEIFKPEDELTGRVGPSVGRVDILKRLLDYTVSTFYPEIWRQYESGEREDMYVAMFEEVVRRTARLVAQWQCVGWCHGVLNTDNMSIVGLTIDYGPFGFMDRFDPQFICNTSDDGGRYSYEKQPEICRWNCGKLAEAIQGAVPLDRTKAVVDSVFDEEFGQCYTATMRRKLGLLKKEFPEDKSLVESLLKVMEETGADFTNSFRCLSRLPLPGMPGFESGRQELLDFLLTQCSTVEEMRKACSPRMDPRQLQMMMMLIQTNPGLLPALGRGFAALSAELDRMERLKELESETQAAKAGRDREKWAQWLMKYADRLKLEADAANQSAESLQTANQERVTAMNGCNPRVVLRNYIAQNAIDAAVKGDYSEVKRVLKILERPFDDAATEDLADAAGGVNVAVSDEASASCRGKETQSGGGDACHARRVVSYDSKPPDWAMDLRVT